MIRFRISSLLILTAIVALLLVVAMRLPVPQQTRFVLQPTPRTTGPTTLVGKTVVIPEHPPVIDDVLLRLLVWSPWAIGGWASFVYLRGRGKTPTSGPVSAKSPAL